MNYNQDKIIDEMILQLGINPCAIYCSNTGSIIGTIDQNHFDLILAMLPAGMDLEEIMDDLLMRTIASMRPSPAFNYARGEALNRMRQVAPAHLASLLLSRFYRLRHRDSRISIIAAAQKQILMFEQLSKLDFSEDSTAQWFLHHLIEADYRFDLSKPHKFGLPAEFTDLDLADLGPVNCALAESIESLQALRDKLERQAKLHESPLRDPGNRSLRSAHVGSFMDLQPLSEAKQKQEKRFELKNLLWHLMNDGAPIEKPEPIVEAPKSPTINGVVRLKIRSN